MKKLFAALALSACFCLTACENSTNSAAASSALKNNGYTVSVFSEEDAKKAFTSITWNVKVVDVVVATKGNNECYYGFFCNNINDASSFVNENVQVLNYTVDEYTGEPAVGSYNNVAYCATVNAVKILGYK